MIYLDNAATTKTYPEAVQVMSEYMTDKFFNPSALYGEAVAVYKEIKLSRDNIKKALHAPDGELYFVSGGTEADNTALFCSKKIRNGKIIVSEGEHDAIINAAYRLKEQGMQVMFAPINPDGSVNAVKFEEMLDEDVALVSIMHVSNETGAINDIKNLVRLVRKKSPDALFHSDGVQAFCKINVNLRALDVDFYSISGHKIHAPKGIGGLFVKKGINVKPLIYGGGQEYGIRSGTENTAAIMAFNCAVNKNIQDFDINYSKKESYIEQLREKLKIDLPETVIITPENAAPHILTVAFKNVRGEVLLHSLEKHGVMVGIGSACSSHHESRFKPLLQLDDAHKDGIVRFSVSEFNETREIDTVIDAIKKELNILTEYTRQ